MTIHYISLTDKIMGRLIIESNDQEALEMIKNFAEKKKVKVVEVMENINNSPVDIMDDIAANTPITSIKDPVAWQKEIRNDWDITFNK